jgi:hypothetical protein
MEPERLEIELADSVPLEEREAFSNLLSQYGDVLEKQYRDPMTAWISFVLIMKQVGTIAGSIAALLKLAEQMIAWRDKLRKKGVEAKVMLRRDGVVPLNVDTASEEEIRRWFHQQL